MASRDLRGLISVARSLGPAARAASANGAGVDLANFESAAVVVETGVVTDGTHTIEVQDSADNVNFAAVADALLQGTEPAIGATDDNTVFEIGYLGQKRYLRAAVTVAGATIGGVYGAHVVRGNPATLPA